MQLKLVYIFHMDLHIVSAFCFIHIKNLLNSVAVVYFHQVPQSDSLSLFQCNCNLNDLFIVFKCITMLGK